MKKYKEIIIIILHVILITLAFSSPLWAKEHNLYMGNITNWFDETKYTNILDNAKEGDIVNIEINSTGGRVDKAYRIMNSIDTTKAFVNIYIDKAQSVAAILATSAHKLYLKDNSNIMFHLARTTDCFEFLLIGTYCILPLDNPHQEKYLDKLNKYSKKYLTKDEYSDIVNGKDVYIKGYQLKLRGN